MSADIIVKGSLLGFMTSFSMGPIFFTLLETGIRKGVRCAMSFSAGVMLSDALIIFLSFVSVHVLFQQSQAQRLLGIIGALALMGFGVYRWFTKESMDRNTGHETQPLGYFLYASKGFLINSLNPFVYLFWFSIVGVLTAQVMRSYVELGWFFGAAWGSVVLLDLLKAHSAARLQHYFTPRTMRTLSRIMGTVLVLFGSGLLWQSLTL